MEFIKSSGVEEHIYFAEILYGDQQPIIKHKNVIVLRCNSPLWNKEAALNVLIQSLPKQYTKVMWIDADIAWFRKTWYDDISKLLDTYKMVQPFSLCYYLNKHGGILNVGIAEFYLHTLWRMGESYKLSPRATLYNKMYECYGMCLATHRDFYDQPIFDKFVVGGGDYILTNPVTRGHLLCEEFIDRNFVDFKSEAMAYAKYVEEYTHANFYYYNEPLIHYYHGNLNSRHYFFRHSVSKQNISNNSIEKNKDGLYEITPAASKEFGPRLLNIFKGRTEDDSQNIRISFVPMWNPETCDGVDFLWLPDSFELELFDIKTIRLYFDRMHNSHTTSYINYVYNNNLYTAEFKTEDELMIEINGCPRMIHFNMNFFIPSIINSDSDDDRRLSCVLRKIEVVDGGRIENYSLKRCLW
jgi:hypothetical protein